MKTDTQSIAPVVPHQKHNVLLGDFLYRVVDLAIAPSLDEWENPIGPGRIELHLCRYKVTKVTRCGVWVEGRRFINMTHPKRYAVPSKHEALASFLKRKKRQIAILEHQLTRAKIAQGMSADTGNILGWNEKN